MNPTSTSLGLQNRVTSWLSLAILGIALSGCSFSAYYNKKEVGGHIPTRASYTIGKTTGTEDVLVALAFSGGGSRSAYMGTAAMFQLQDVYTDINLLKEVDVISGVSGGSIPAAYYCITKDKLGYAARSGRVWDEETAKKEMGRNYQGKWIGNNFWPYNFFRYLFTAYDRTDIMAQTLEDNLFDTGAFGSALTFADLNPDRPYLIINATEATQDYNGESHFGNIFTFTDDDFAERIGSDLSVYPLAWAVMASCTFPGVFNYMTLKDFRDLEDDQDRYVHLFDGGIADNLALESIKKVILRSTFVEDAPKYRHFVVILVDASQQGCGVDSTDYDPRSLISNLFDTNILEAFDALMKFRRDDLLGQFNTGILDVDKERKVGIDNLTFWHLSFADLESGIKDHTGEDLKKKIFDIPTDFDIDEDDMLRIDQAIKLMIDPDNPMLRKIVDVLYYPDLEGGAE